MHVKRVVNAQKFSPEKMQKVNLFETANFFNEQRAVVLVTMAPNPNSKNTSGGGA